MDENYDVDITDAGASNCFCRSRTDSKRWDIMIKGKPCKAKDVSTSKTGNGHAKCTFCIRYFYRSIL